MAEVLVLCYHAVSHSWDASESVTPDALERQLTYLKRGGWRSATFRDAVLDPPAARTVAITFDDAFASVKELALLIVSGLGMTATVFAPPAYVGTGDRCAWAGLDGWTSTAHAAELAPMSWEELGELAESSWQIGAHTRTHPHLTKLEDAERRECIAARPRGRSRRAGDRGQPGRCSNVAHQPKKPLIALLAALAGVLIAGCERAPTSSSSPARRCRTRRVA